MKQLKTNETIGYTPKTRKYGYAYFSIGVKRGEYGVIKELHIIRDQQPSHETTHYTYKPESEHTDFHVERYPMDLEIPKHSDTIYCEKHDLVEEHWRVPNHSNELQIKEYGSGIEITFRGDK